MSILLIVLTFSLIAATSTLCYLLFPRLGLKHMIWRAVVFFAVIDFLAVDSFVHEKYGLMAAMGLGLIGFIILLRNSRVQ